MIEKARLLKATHVHVIICHATERMWSSRSANIVDQKWVRKLRLNSVWMHSVWVHPERSNVGEVWRHRKWGHHIVSKTKQRTGGALILGLVVGTRRKFVWIIHRGFEYYS